MDHPIISADGHIDLPVLPESLWRDNAPAGVRERMPRIVEKPNGKFWVSAKGKELGLVDHLGDMRSFLKGRYGEKTRLKLISQPRGLFGMRGGIPGVSQIGASAANALIDTAEERALWARYGL